MKTKLYKNEERQLKELKALLVDINKQLEKLTLILGYYRANDKKLYFFVKQYIKGKNNDLDFFITPRLYLDMRDNLKKSLVNISDLTNTSNLLTFIERKKLVNV